VTSGAAKRWTSPQLSVPGLPTDAPERPSLPQRRALAIAALLKEQGIAAIAAPASGQTFRLQIAATMSR